MIRKMNDHDTNQVMEIWLQGNVSAHSFIPADYWISHEEEVRQAMQLAEVYVCEQDGKVIGFIGLQGSYVAGLFVEERMRSLGVGKLLLSHAKNLKDSLQLKVYAKNMRAIDFYHREGFFIDDESFEETTGELEFLMCWYKCGNYEPVVVKGAQFEPLVA